MLLPKQSRPRQKRRGVAVVEFAIVAPFLVVITMGMIELTRALQVKHVLADAVRSSTRLAILPGATDSAVQQNAKDVLKENGLDPSSATFAIQVNDKTANVSTAKQYDKISVKIAIPTAKVGWVIPHFLPSNAVESETLVMMRQR
jgi:Flp pilus assembly protein TadG